jgi:RND family efflux transporter MFP subunit
MQPKQFFAMLILTMVAAGAGQAADEGATGQTAAPRPVVSQIAGETVEAARDYIGMVSARIEVDLGFPVSGTIATRPVNLGDTVDRGDILAQLDPETLDAAAWAARAGVVVASNQLASARDTMERERTLVERGVESQSRLEDAERGFAAAKARLAQAQADLARAEDLLDSATLRAPYDGVITFVMSEAGAAVSTGQAVVRLASTSEREVVIDLSEAELAALPEKAEFEASLLAVRNTSATIRLRSVDPVADSQTRTRRVHFALVDPVSSFRIGALVRVEPPRGGGRVVILPKSAILQGDDGPHVWLVSRPDGIARRVPVILGPELGDRVLITSGVDIGQEIIIKGINSIEDGQSVGPRVRR